MALALFPLGAQPIAGTPATQVGQGPPSYTTGVFWPSIFPQAARAISTTTDQIGDLILGAAGQANTPGGQGSPGGNLLLFRGLNWQTGPSIPDPQPAAIQGVSGVLPPPGYALDSFAGLLPWNAGAAAFQAPAPWTSLALSPSGLYATTPSGLFTVAGGAVSGIATTGVFASLATGSTIYLLASGTIYTATLSSSTSASIASASLPFTATAMGLSGSGLAIGGYNSYSIASGGLAIAALPASNIFVAFPGGTTASTWLLSGSPPAWSLFQSSAVSAYSTTLAAAFAHDGSQVLVADSASGHWFAYSYTGGVLALLSSGSAAGITPIISIDSTNTRAVVPQPGASGFFALTTSGSGWASSGTVVTGAPGAATAQLVSGQTWAAGWTNAIGLLSLTPNGWSLSQSGSLPWTPVRSAYDSNFQALWVAASGGQAVLAQWAGQQSPPVILASGTWTAGAGSATAGAIQSRGQFVLATTSPTRLFTAGQETPGVIASGSQPAVLTATPTALAGPLIDGSLAVGSASAISFWQFASPFTLQSVQNGVWAELAGGSLGTTQTLGYLQTPSALGPGTSGETWLATTAGWLGTLSGAPSSLASSLPSGGYSGGLVSSGLLFLTTTVQGSLLATSGSL